MALPANLPKYFGTPHPTFVENTETSEPGHENNNMRLYELFDVEFNPSDLVSGDTLVFNATTRKFQRAILSKVAAVAPAATDDANDGYIIGSVWTNTVGPELYVATAVTVGAATWLQIV